MMHVVVESTKYVTEARRLLANIVVREALGAVWKHVESARFRLPDGALEERCTLEVQLVSGAKLECHGMGANMADAFECAAHGIRRKVYDELGIVLPVRARTASAASAERRAS